MDLSLVNQIVRDVDTQVRQRRLEEHAEPGPALCQVDRSSTVFAPDCTGALRQLAD